ncbi:sel1 repeat family protein, partial [Mesorhizobium sp. BHbdii]
AEFWWLAAAKTGNADAEASLGMLYYRGMDGKPNYAEAAKWFFKAAAHGSPSAKTYLEMMKENGQIDSKLL